MAFFFCRQNLCKHITTPILNEYPFKAKNYLYVFYKNSWKQCPEKRTLCFILSFSFKGSITTEAAFVLPLFLFAVINLLSVIQILTCYGRVEAALHQTAKKMSVYAALFQTEQPAFIEEAYAAYSVKEKLGKNYLRISPIENGGDGIDFSLSEVMGEEECIDLTAVYRVNPAVSMLGFGRFTLMNRCRMRAWTGYDNRQAKGEEAENDLIVYLAETGEVYHTSASCTHLQLSIQRIEFAAVTGFRNEGGEKYKECELCGGGIKLLSAYITKQGNRYHSRITCSGLKRNIVTVPLSQAGARPACSRCGG